jgi:hypothetical protein
MIHIAGPDSNGRMKPGADRDGVAPIAHNNRQGVTKLPPKLNTHDPTDSDLSNPFL